MHICWKARNLTRRADRLDAILAPATRRSGDRFARVVCMEYHEDPTARVRERRFQGLVSELLPKVRRLNPTMPDDQVREMAESMAELRLLDEELG